MEKVNCSLFCVAVLGESGNSYPDMSVGWESGREKNLDFNVFFGGDSEFQFH